MKDSHIFILFMCLSGIQSFAQIEKGRVALIGKATSNKIKLRWAPSSPGVWFNANKYGYTLEKIVFMENGVILDNPSKEIFSIEPKPLIEWQELVDENDYAAIAAQAIYGESFEMDNQFSNPMIRTINQAKELENRYSFALYAADMSMKTAEWSGLYFEDEQVSNDYKYLYRLYNNSPNGSVASDTVSILIGLDDFRELPVITNVQTEFRDRFVEIVWKGLYQKEYTAYWVEKSMNGKDFERIHSAPMVFPESESQSFLYKADSLLDNHTTYYYRIIGVDPFGDVGPPSEVVSGNGKPNFLFAPKLESGEVDPITGFVKLKWSFPNQGSNQLDHFSIYYGIKSNGNFQLVSDELNKDNRLFTDSLTQLSGYYLVEATDKYLNSTRSFPLLVQLEDSIPPMPPSGFAGHIDTLGRVFLNWEANAEVDLYGYKLYRSNFEDQEYTEISGKIITDNSFVDSIKLNNLTEEIYYKLRAFDKRLNPSDFTSSLKLKKPDLIPPVAPIIEKVAIDSVGIVIEWEKSSSGDVEKHLIYRRAQGESSWTLKHVAEFSNYYLDKEVMHQIQYAYTVVAVDDDGLESEPASPIVTKWFSQTPYPKIIHLSQSIDSEERKVILRWEYDQDNITKFQIYKSKNGGTMALFRVIDAEQNVISDTFHPSDELLEYQINALFVNGELSPFSDKVKFEF